MTVQRSQLLTDMSDSLGQLKRAMHAYANQHYTKFDMSFGQLGVLRIIHFLQPVSHKALAKHMQMTPGAISQLLEGLAKADCIVRTSNEADRRVTYLSISRHGKQVLQQFGKLHMQTMTDAAADVSDEDLSAYVRVQQSMTKWLENHANRKES